MWAWLEKLSGAARNEWEENGASQIREIRDAMDVGLASVIEVDGDVCGKYRWSVNNPEQKYLGEVPKIILTEYQSNTGPILESLELFAKTLGRVGQTAGQAGENIVAGAGAVKDPAAAKLNPYLEMYKGVHTGNVYQLPFFNAYNHTMNNTWAEGKEMAVQAAVGSALRLLGDLGQKGNVEKRRVWTGTSPASYSFSFTLYNTFDVNDIMQNLLFVRGLLNNNMATRTSFATMLPPCFYKVEIPGVRYSPMAVLAGIDVTNVGQVNRTPMSLPTGDGAFHSMDVNIPDAWSINITVNELLKETRNILGSVYKPEGSKVNVITTQDAINGQNIDYQDTKGGGITR